MWGDDHAQKNGRQGQPQNGVDIFGRPNTQSSWAGVQCKEKNGLIGSTLTEAELNEEVEKAKSFFPKLASFTIAYTGPRNAALQTRARQITEFHEQHQLFTVHVWCWEDILERLNNFPDVFRRQFPHFDALYRIWPKQDRGSVDDLWSHSVPEQQDVLIHFKQPSSVGAMKRRETLCPTVEDVLQTHSSVYLNAPSGYGKSVLMTQLTLPNVAWIDCADEYKDFQQFRPHIARFFRAKYSISIVPEPPSELARAVDLAVAKSSEATLVVALDNADGVDNGIKTFAETLITSAASVRVLLAASHLHLKRQAAMEVSRRLKVISAVDLAFSEEETTSVIAAPLAGPAMPPTPAFSRLVHEITNGWPIAVQLQ